jgi:hypothetical protein
MFITVLEALAVGLVVAGCGAWKDTLFEPFEPVKFFRSPVLIVGYAAVLSTFWPKVQREFVVLSSCALERLTTECWKAVVRKPPGKFQLPDQDRGWLIDRLDGNSGV